MAEPGKCEICGSRPARLLMLRRRLGLDERTYVCAECSKGRRRLYGVPMVSPYDGSAPLDQSLPIGVSADRCEFCGSRLREADDTKPGCAACYDRFDDVIEQRLRSVQGASRHVGKTPSR